MQAIPEGFHTVVPSLVLKNAARAIELYEKALGATVIHRMECPETKKIMHACLEIGNSRIFLSDEMPGMCVASSNAGFYLYLPDVDAAFARAKEAGMTEKYAPQDMFWGDRTGTVMDEAGITWTLATHTRDVSQEDMEKGAKEMMSQMKTGDKAA